MTNLRGFVAVMLLCVVFMSGCKDKKPMAGAPVQLPVAEVAVENVPVTMAFSGQINGYKSINIDARAAGYLRSMLFREGSFVRVGQLLYVVEPAPYAAQTVQSEAAVRRADATLVEAEQNYNRVKPLAEFNAASRSDLDAASAQLAQARANLAAAKAALLNSKINQSYTQLSSPVNGIIGQTKAQIGAFVGAESQILTLNTVSQVDSVKVDFFIPETLYTQMRTQRGGVSMQGIRLTTADGQTYPHPGRFNFVGREVQAQTGALNVEVVFPNPDTLLRPGAFALVSVVTDTLRGALLVPQKAINQIQGYDYLYVLDKSGNVTRQSITSGRNVGDSRVVLSGVSGGETIITEGFHKIYPGVKVEPMTVKK